jgi:hypothetical protein
VLKLIFKAITVVKAGTKLGPIYPRMLGLEHVDDCVERAVMVSRYAFAFA